MSDILTYGMKERLSKLLYPPFKQCLTINAANSECHALVLGIQSQKIIIEYQYLLNTIIFSPIYKQYNNYTIFFLLTTKSLLVAKLFY